MGKGAAKRFIAKYMKDSYVLVWRKWFDIQYVKGISKLISSDESGLCHG